MERFRWILAAAVSGLACHFAVLHATPVDRALPFLAIVVTVLAAVSYPSVMIGVPLLVLAEVAVLDEGMRLLALGAILAGAVVAGVLEGRRKDSWSGSAITAIAALVVLRWIPIQDVLIGRELALLVMAVLMVYILDRTPLAIAIAVIVTLAAPAVPLRTLALPMLVVVLVFVARVAGMKRIELVWPSTVAMAVMMLFFAWSGVVARGFPWLLRQANAEPQRIETHQALAPRAEAVLEVPPGATSLIVSGANVARLKRGTLLGRIEPGGLDVRIGDAADWGYMRRDQFHAARNPLPRDPAGRLRGYGFTAWIDGAGRVRLPSGVKRIRVIAGAALPADAALQIEGFE